MSRKNGGFAADLTAGIDQRVLRVADRCDGHTLGFEQFDDGHGRQSPRPGVDPGLSRPPVVAAAPVVYRLLHHLDGDPELPRLARRLVGKPGAVKATVQVIEDGLVDPDGVGLGSQRHG